MTRCRTSSPTSCAPRELADDPEHPALAALVAHEQTIAAFTDLELSGHADVTRAFLERYLVSAP